MGIHKSFCVEVWPSLTARRVYSLVVFAVQFSHRSYNLSAPALHFRSDPVPLFTRPNFVERNRNLLFPVHSSSFNTHPPLIYRLGPTFCHVSVGLQALCSDVSDLRPDPVSAVFWSVSWVRRSVLPAAARHDRTLRAHLRPPEDPPGRQTTAGN